MEVIREVRNKVDLDEDRILQAGRGAPSANWAQGFDSGMGQTIGRQENLFITTKLLKKYRVEFQNEDFEYLNVEEMKDLDATWL